MSAPADYGLPAGVPVEGLDTAYTEETIRRAKDLADQLFEDLAAGGSLENRERAEELSEVLYRLGIHLDRTYGLNITGGGR